MSKFSFLIQIKTFVSGHLVLAIVASAVVVVGAAVGTITVIANAQNKDMEVAANTPAENSEEERVKFSEELGKKDQGQELKDEEKPSTSGASGTAVSTKPATSQSQTANTNTATQQPVTSSNQSITPSKSSTGQTQPSQSATPTQPSQSANAVQPSQSANSAQPAAPVEPVEPIDNKIWGNPYIYKENGVYYCDRGNGFVKCKTFAEMIAAGESVGCGMGPVEEGYKPSQYGCFAVPEDFE